MSKNLETVMKEINTERKTHKNDWWAYIGEIAGKKFRIKAYNTWIQRLETEEWTDSGPSDCSVGVFNSYLTDKLGGL